VLLPWWRHYIETLGRPQQDYLSLTCCNRIGLSKHIPIFSKGALAPITYKISFCTSVVHSNKLLPTYIDHRCANNSNCWQQMIVFFRQLLFPSASSVTPIKLNPVYRTSVNSLNFQRKTNKLMLLLIFPA
jgi:hypothetical protein